MTRFHLAQVNIGRIIAPIDDPRMEGFRSQLDPINALADRSPGFVWRLQTEDGNATAIRPFDGDDRMAINMSTWTTIEALQQYVYQSAERLVALAAADPTVRAETGAELRRRVVAEHSVGAWADDVTEIVARLRPE